MRQPQAMFKVLHRTPDIPEALSAEGKDFLSLCFRRNPAERPSAKKLLNHPFVRNSNDQNVSSYTRAFSLVNLMVRNFFSLYNKGKHQTGKKGLLEW